LKGEIKAMGHKNIFETIQNMADFLQKFCHKNRLNIKGESLMPLHNPPETVFSKMSTSKINGNNL
jgi:hypothetical protein